MRREPLSKERLMKRNEEALSGSGVVTKLAFANPHSQLYFDVTV